MDVDEYQRYDAVGLAALVRDRKASAPELRAVASEIQERSTEFNAVVEWYEDPRPPIDDGVLSGVPFLRKDLGSSEAGRLVEMGSRLARDFREQETSSFYRRLGRAGVQVLGRTAVPEFGQHATTESFAFGATLNPLDPTRSAGGSSGGAAAAVASGVVPIAHASDAAGSIRIPAAVTGLLGLKPTRDLIEPPRDRWRGLVCEFVIGRSLRDLDCCLEVLASQAPPEPAMGAQRIGLALGHWADLENDPTVIAAVEAAARRLEDRGHRVELIDRPFDYERLMDTWFPLFIGGVADVIDRVSAATGRVQDLSNLEPNTLEALAKFRSLGADAVAVAERTKTDITQALHTQLGAIDIIMTPTLDRLTIPLGRMAGDAPMDRYLADGDEWFSRLYLANVIGWPAMSVPALAGGQQTSRSALPVGVQLVARPGQDRTLLRLASELGE